MTEPQYPACPACGCEARHTADTSTPQINWCQHCTACCWTGSEPQVRTKTLLGTPDFGVGWAGAQLRRLMRTASLLGR